MPGTNLIGPFGEGVNETYDTPDFGDSGGSEFSWYVDCSSDVADDGTKWTARWANRIMLQLRRGVIGMGIPLNEVDGDSLYKAILRAHRPIVNIGAGAALHKGEKMPEWQHELRSLVGAGTVTVNVVGDTVVITGAAGSSVTLQSLGAGVPVYKGVAGSVHQFRSLMAELGVEVASTTNEAVFRLAPQPGWSIMLRNAASSGRPTGVAIDELTEETTPALDDWILLQRNPGRELRKAKRRNLQYGIKGLIGQGTTTLGTEQSQSGAGWGGDFNDVLTGTIAANPSGGVSTIVISAEIRARLESTAFEPAAAGIDLLMQYDAGAGWVDLAPYYAQSRNLYSNEFVQPIITRHLVPISGNIVDAAGAVNWRLRARMAGGSNVAVEVSTHVVWQQFG